VHRTAAAGINCGVLVPAPPRPVTLKFGRLGMCLSKRMSGILSRWQGEDIRRRDPDLAVWDLGWPGLLARHRRQRREAFAACRRDLLTTLMGSSGPAFLMHSEPPAEYEIPGDWQPKGEATWLVPPDFNPDDPVGSHWLSLGAWRLYSAPGPAEGKWPNVFRCRAAELLDWMNGKSVCALIESFHDDTDWVVALSAAEPDGAPDRAGGE
jgi:hypothetical protein